MDCSRFIFSSHALRRMFEREIDRDAIIEVVNLGVIIESYPNDSPYPSVLFLGFIKEMPLHVVVARNPSTRECIVVTVYIPDSTIWERDFRSRRE